MIHLAPASAFFWSFSSALSGILYFCRGVFFEIDAHEFQAGHEFITVAKDTPELVTLLPSPNECYDYKE